MIAFVRNTLTKKKCDVIIGTPTGDPLVLNTNPYYRWGYAMIYLADGGIEVDRPDHPQLAELRWERWPEHRPIMLFIAIT